MLSNNLRWAWTFIISRKFKERKQSHHAQCSTIESQWGCAFFQHEPRLKAGCCRLCQRICEIIFCYFVSLLDVSIWEIWCLNLFYHNKFRFEIIISLSIYWERINCWLQLYNKYWLVDIVGQDKRLLNWKFRRED